MLILINIAYKERNSYDSALVEKKIYILRASTNCYIRRKPKIEEYNATNQYTETPIKPTN